MTPPSLARRPTLDSRQTYYFEAFQGISRSRSVSMGGPLPIPVSEILAYCELFQIDQLNERERIFKFTNRLDSIYLEHVAAQAEKNKPK